MDVKYFSYTRVCEQGLTLLVGRLKSHQSGILKHYTTELWNCPKGMSGLKILTVQKRLKNSVKDGSVRHSYTTARVPLISTTNAKWVHGYGCFRCLSTSTAEN